MGKAAVRLLQKYIDDPDAPSETVCVENKLIVREST
jgi:DNA-binding LacI/PurR family transcriptional regulator